MIDPRVNQMCVYVFRTGYYCAKVTPHGDVYALGYPSARLPMAVLKKMREEGWEEGWDEEDDGYVDEEGYVDDDDEGYADDQDIEPELPDPRKVTTIVPFNHPIHVCVGLTPLPRTAPQEP